MVIDDAALIRTATEYLHHVLTTTLTDDASLRDAEDRERKTLLAFNIWQTGMSHPED